MRGGKDTDMKRQFIIRYGWIEQVWQYKFKLNGFETYILIRGTEPETREYINEIPVNDGWIHALTENEIQAAKNAGHKIYCAPEIVPEMHGTC